MFVLENPISASAELMAMVFLLFVQFEEAYLPHVYGNFLRLFRKLSKTIDYHFMTIYLSKSPFFSPPLSMVTQLSQNFMNLAPANLSNHGFIYHLRCSLMINYHYPSIFFSFFHIVYYCINQLITFLLSMKSISLKSSEVILISISFS